MSTALADSREESSATRDLARVLSLRDAIVLVLSVIGTGVFLKSAVMAQLVGSPSKVMWAWAAAGILSLAGALTYAELGAMLPKAGGEYVFLREAYGDLAAFLFGWTSVILIGAGGIAAISTALASFLGAFVDVNAVWMTRDLHVLGQSIHWRLGLQQLVAVAVIVLLSAINARGVQLGSRVQWVSTLAKLGGIAVIVLGAFFLSKTGSAANLHETATAAVAPGGSGAFGAAMLAALWAYQGWTQVAMVAGEIDKPERNVPRALVYGMLIVIGVYLLANVAFFYVLPFSEALKSNSTAYPDALPIAARAARTFFSYGAQLVSLAFVIAAFGTVNAIILMQSRVPFAMARDNLFFRPIARLNERGVPANAIWFLAIWAILLALSGTFDQITTSVVFAFWIFTALVAASLFLLRRKLPVAPRRYRTLGYPVVPMLFVLVAVWLVINSLVTSPVESAAGVLLIALGLPVYWYLRRRGWMHRARVRDSAE